MMGTLRVGALLCKPLGVLIGFIYPAFASWKALESRKGEAATGQSAARSQGKDGWLTYWVVFSCFTVLEHVADFLISWRARTQNARCVRCNAESAAAQDAAVLRGQARVRHLAAGAADQGAFMRARVKAPK
jgi:hypothetical protein